MSYPGKFIVVEGIDGSGKTTLIENLKKILKGGIVYTQEPYRSTISNPSALSEATLVLAYAADRSQHLDDVIIPALKAGKTVICDRYIYSSIVYQSSIAEGRIRWAHTITRDAEIPEPDLIIFMNTDPAVACGRLRARGESAMVKNLQEFSYRYYDLFKNSSKVYKVGESNSFASPDWVAVTVSKEINKLIGNKPHCNSDNCQDIKLKSSFNLSLNTLDSQCVIDTLNQIQFKIGDLYRIIDDLEERVDELE